MAFLYIKALHIIFVVTWFSGLFYLVRLFIYNAEANEKPESEKRILQAQFSIMMKRLLYGITWPSAVLTLVFGLWLLMYYPVIPVWLWIKLAFVVGLFLYHFSLQSIYKQQINGVFKYSSTQLRVWNEMATIFLVAIVILVVVRQEISLFYALIGLVCFVIILMSAIKIYKSLR
ncbi:MAG: CopD family protein [Chitinophagales bacterium]